MRNVLPCSLCFTILYLCATHCVHYVLHSYKIHRIAFLQDTHSTNSQLLINDDVSIEVDLRKTRFIQPSESLS